MSDLKLQRRILAHRGVFDSTLQRYAMVSTNLDDISIRRTTDDQELFRLPQTAGIVDWIGQFSPDGKLLLVWCLDHTLRIWDLERRAIKLSVSFDPTCNLDFSPDGERMVVVTGKAEASIYQLATGRKLDSFPTPFAAQWVRFDPAGRQIAISAITTNRVAILDAYTGASRLVLTTAEGIRGLAWHPRQPILAAAGDPLVYLWDAVDGRLIRTSKGHEVS